MAGRVTGVRAKRFGKKAESLRMDKALKLRLALAIRKRTFPNTALRHEVLAHAIGAHPDSVRNWAHEVTSPNIDKVHRMAEVFAATGDLMFITEVFGAKVTPISARPPAKDIAAAVTDLLLARGLAA